MTGPGDDEGRKKDGEGGRQEGRGVDRKKEKREGRNTVEVRRE